MADVYRFWSHIKSIWTGTQFKTQVIRYSISTIRHWADHNVPLYKLCCTNEPFSNTNTHHGLPVSLVSWVYRLHSLLVATWALLKPDNFIPLKSLKLAALVSYIKMKLFYVAILSYPIAWQMKSL